MTDPRPRAFNFSAGPSALPEAVLRRAQAELLDWGGTGMGLIEMSHRDPGGPVQGVMAAAERDLRALLGISDRYAVLFQHGGAHGQFAAVPLNLACGGATGAYVRAGFWGERARQEAARFIETTVAADASDEGGVRSPPVSRWQVGDGAAYVHVCANETIQGIELLADPDWPADRPPLVADFTSTLLSRPVDVDRYGVIYASSGKNLGPSGVAVVIARRDLIERGAQRATPSILDWGLAARSQPIGSLHNTPATFAIHLLSLVLDDLRARGGVEAMARRAAHHAGRLYELIDGSGGVYHNGIDPAARSRMNVPFRVLGGDPAAEARFTREAEERGLLQVFGHPLFGGQRISLYNGVPDEALDAVAAFLDEFARRAR